MRGVNASVQKTDCCTVRNHEHPGCALRNKVQAIFGVVLYSYTNIEYRTSLIVVEYV